MNKTSYNSFGQGKFKSQNENIDAFIDYNSNQIVINKNIRIKNNIGRRR